MSKEMSINVHKPRGVVLARREQVKDLYFIRNYTVHQVAKALEKNPRTISRDINEIRESYNQQIKTVSIDGVLARLIRTRSKIVQKLWKEYDENPGRRAWILEIIDRIEEKWIKNLQDLSFIKKPVERHQVENVTYEFKIIEDGSKKSKTGLGTKSKAKKGPRNSKR